jgi:hypothetical protein
LIPRREEVMDNIDRYIQAVAESVEAFFIQYPDPDLRIRVEFFERFMRYCSQQRNHYLRKYVDEQRMKREET